MSFILTFLGKGDTVRTTVAIAAAKRFAAQGKRVLLLGQDPTLALMTGITSSPDPQEIAPNLQVLQVQITTLLERSWEEVKKLEAQYLRTPVLKSVFGQELGVFSGMDNALVLNALREFDASGHYDVIIYDGSGDQATLRMLGMPETLSWYVRRFRQVFADSDFGKTIVPLLQPIIGAMFNVDWLSGNFAQPTNQMNNLLDQGKAAVADPTRMAAFLITSGEAGAIAQTRYLWGSSQQIGLTVGGVLLTSGSDTTPADFDPLPITSIPTVAGDNWQPLVDALPDFQQQAIAAPRSMSIDTVDRKVRLFLPGFDKKQVKLTQNGPEVTIEAGDQRHNIFLPPELSGRPVTGAKFQDSYLTISF